MGRATPHNLALIGVRDDGSRKVLARGLTQQQAENITAALGPVAFRQVIIKPKRVVRKPP